jgi:hypothetical protein
MSCKLCVDCDNTDCCGQECCKSNEENRCIIEDDCCEGFEGMIPIFPWEMS